MQLLFSCCSLVFVIIFEIEEVFWVKISNGLFRMTLEIYVVYQFTLKIGSSVYERQRWLSIGIFTNTHNWQYGVLALMSPLYSHKFTVSLIIYTMLVIVKLKVSWKKGLHFKVTDFIDLSNFE